jgi:putative ABC transport system permease protein
MLLSDIFKLAIKALVDRKARSVLTILGIMIGSAIILALIASSSGLSAGVQSQIDRIGANTLIVRSATQFYVSGGQTSFQMSQDDVNIMKTFQGVSDVIPFYSKGISIVSGGSSIQGSLQGIDSNSLFKLYRGLTLYDGGLPNPYDPTAATIGYGIAFPPGLASQLADVNQMISVTLPGVKGGLAFLVKGILAQYGSVAFQNIDDTIFISLQGAQILFKTPYYSGVYVLTNTPDDVASVQQIVQNYYGNNVRIMGASAILTSVQAITGQMTVFLGSIGAVSLFVAAVGITNTMFVSVMERTREIGVLKALGYRPRQIMGIFLSEAVVTGAVGGVLGTMFGYVLSFMIGGSMPLSGPMRFFGGGAESQPVFTPQLLSFSLLFPILVSVLAGLYPAWRASRMNAVVALKYE